MKLRMQAQQTGKCGRPEGRRGVRAWALAAVIGALLGAGSESPVGAQPTAFTYQGRLNDSGGSAASYYFTFGLFPQEAGGSAIETLSDVQATVTGGLFTTELNFTAPGAFDGSDRWLEISVKRNVGDSYTLLTPRQPISSAPYAMRATTAGDAENLGGIASASYLQAAGSGASLTDLNASSLASGTVADERLSTAVARLNTSQTFTGDQTIAGNLTQSGTLASFDLTNGFVAVGQQDVGATPVEGAGTRFMWYPAKGALRAGTINGTQWDDPNIGYQSMAFGNNVRATGDYAFASGNATFAANASSTAMGEGCLASGYLSVALGHYAHTNSRRGSFVFADHNFDATADPLSPAYFKASAVNEFSARATGGVRFFTSLDLSTGATLSAGGGSWNTVSDRDAKTNITTVNPRQILESVLKLPIATWNYKTQTAEFRHIGPMAQDFYKLFKVGEDDKHITQVDPDGVALAAIQGLHAELQERDARLDRQQEEIDALKAQVEKQQTVIDAMQEFLAKQEALEAQGAQQK